MSSFRDKQKLDLRRRYVKKTVKERSTNGDKVDDIVNDIADDLFLSPRTIYRDLSFQSGKASSY